jgi:hypothetical protein
MSSIVPMTYAKAKTTPQHPIGSGVDLIVKLYKEQQWAKVYDLLNQERQRGISREKHVQGSHPHWTLLEFTPTRVQRLPGHESGWYVNGCVFADDHGKKNQ